MKQRTTTVKQICICQFTVPELKIIFVVFYWLVLSAMIWTGAGIKAGRKDAFDFYLRNYADCMAGGNRNGHDCHKLRLELEAQTVPVLEVVYFTMVAFVNFALLPLVVQFQTVKHTIRQATWKFGTMTTK